MNYIIAQQKLTAEKLIRRKTNGVDRKNIIRLKKAFTYFDKYSDKELPFLDIGSRDGWFLHYLIKNGYKNVQGIDISLDAVKWMLREDLIAQQVNVCNMKIFKNESFGTVTLIHVLEHCPQPEIALENIYRILKVDGILYIEIPLEKIPKMKSAHFSSFISGSTLIDICINKFEVLYCNPDKNLILPKSNFSCVLRKKII